MLPTKCPSCQSELKVKSLVCDKCETEVTGCYELPVIAKLSPEDQEFILSFIKHSGSLKDMAAQLKLSYPTVRNILNELIDKIRSYENE